MSRIVFGLADNKCTVAVFSFTAKGDAAHGQLITHVNGLKGPAKTFWAIFRRTEQGDCLTPLSRQNLIISIVKIVLLQTVLVDLPIFIGNSTYY